VITVAKELHLGTDFPKTDHAMWHKQVEVELKGADFDKRMLLRSYEGIELQALYTEEVFPTVSDSGGLSGYVPFVRGAQPLGNMLAGRAPGTRASGPCGGQLAHPRRPE
jgi:methylmalonyl-CoA mutase